MNSSLRELSDIEYGASPKEIRADDKTPVSIYGTSGFLGYATKPLFDGPLVVVARKGTLDNPIYVEGDCWVIDTAFAVLPKPDVEAKWLYYQLSNYDLKKLNESTGVPSISREYLYRLAFKNPGGAHQRKITRILTAIDKAIEQTGQTIGKLKKIKQGMMHDLFTRGIDVKTGELRPPYSEAPRLYKQTELGWIPNNWSVLLIKEFANVISGATPSTEIPEYWDGQINWITPADLSKLESLYFNSTSRKLTKEGLQNCSAVILPKYSIVMSSRAPIGYFAIGTEEFATNQGCKSYQLFANQSVEFHYYSMVFNTNKFIRFGSGSTFTEISKTDIENLKLSVPDDFREQSSIGARLLAIDQALCNERLSLRKYFKLKQGLMQDLLTGKVEVTPDPQDKEYQGASR